MTTRLAATDFATDPLSQSLHELGSRIGDNTRLGSFLMSADAAPVILVFSGLMLVVLLIVMIKRARQRKLARQAIVPEPAAETPVTGRPQPEALAKLYDAPMARQEPAVPAQSAAPSPAASPAPVAAAVAAPAMTVAAPTAAGDDQGSMRENAASRLLVAAVDRLLHRVESQQAQIHALLDELKAQSSALMVQGERLLALEARVAELPGQAAASSESEPAEPARLASLDQAIALAGQGLSEEELVNRCGLSAAEARLINLVHGQPASGSAA